MNSKLVKSDVIVFDIGNVLLEYSPTFLLKKSLNSEDKAYMDGIFKSKHWQSLDRGTISVDEAAQLMSEEGSLDRAKVLKLLNTFAEFMPEMPAASLISSLKEQGKKLYLLSNFQEKAFEQVRHRHEFFKKIDGWVVSSHVKINKPDFGIYKCLIDKFELNPKNCCFIDDTLENIEAALKMGFETIHYENFNSLL